MSWTPPAGWNDGELLRRLADEQARVRREARLAEVDARVSAARTASIIAAAGRAARAVAARKAAAGQRFVERVKADVELERASAGRRWWAMTSSGGTWTPPPESELEWLRQYRQRRQEPETITMTVESWNALQEQA